MNVKKFKEGINLIKDSFTVETIEEKLAYINEHSSEMTKEEIIKLLNETTNESLLNEIKDSKEVKEFIGMCNDKKKKAVNFLRGLLDKIDD